MPTRPVLFVLLACSTALGQKPAPSQRDTAPGPVVAARNFLPPQSDLADLYRIEYHPQWTVVRWPAVLVGHIIEPHSQDIVFAYYNPQIHVLDKTLFLDVLRQTPRGYEKVYEVSYRSQVLLVPQAIRVLHLQGVSTDAVAVIAGMGADLGGHLQVFLWRDPWGWQNIFPPNGSMHYFYFFPRETGLDVALSASKHPGLDVSPPPVWYRWNGEQFVKIPPPQGSSKWSVPD